MKPAIKSAIVVLGLLASVGASTEVLGASFKAGDRAYSDLETMVRVTSPDGKIELISKALQAGTITAISSDGTAQFEADARDGHKPQRILLMKSDLAQLKRAAACPALTDATVYSTAQHFNQENQGKKIKDLGLVNVTEVFGNCENGIATVRSLSGISTQVAVALLLSDTRCAFSNGRVQVAGRGAGYITHVYGNCETGKALFSSDITADSEQSRSFVDVSQIVGPNASADTRPSSKAFNFSNSSSAAVTR